MELRSLTHFRAVARHGNVSRAAEALHVAQPSLSRTIARLEAELGVPLFDRHGRRVVLNRFGARFLARVDRALADLEAARQEVRDLAGLEQGTVAVASETLLTLAAPLTAFRAAHPGVDVRLFQSSADSMGELLRTGDVDLCFASQPVQGPALATIELVREEVFLAVPPDHHLAGADRVDVAALADEPFVITSPGQWQRTLADRLFAEAGVRPTIVCEGDEPAAILELIGAGLGVGGLIPAMGRRAWRGAAVAWVRLATPEARRTLSVVWRDDAYLPAAARRLRDLAVDHFRDPPTIGGSAGGRGASAGERRETR